MLGRTGLAWVAMALCSAEILAQEVVWRVVGTTTETVREPAVFLSDLDGDGWEELAVPVLKGAGQGPAGTRILSGRDGGTLREDGLAMLWDFFLARVGDMDGDGAVDYATTRQTPGMNDRIVEVRSGRDGAVLWQVAGMANESFGRHLVGDLDLDGDGRPDLLISAQARRPGAVQAHDHAGRLLYTVVSELVIWTIGPADDVDGDGAQDWLMSTATPEQLGRIQVRSGRSGKLLLEVRGELPWDVIGRDGVGGVGDVDADGVPDFVGVTRGLPGGRGPAAEVFSGATGHRIRVWRRAPGPSSFGGLCGKGDLDADGVVDLLVLSAACSAGTGYEWLSLRDGTSVTCLNETERVRIGSPRPGDVFPLLSFADLGYRPSQTSPQLGRVTLVRSAPANVTTLGAGCSGTLPAAPRMGWRVLGAGARVHMSGAPPGAPGALLVGRSSQSWLGLPLPLALDPFGFPGCRLYTAVDVAVPVVTGTTGLTRGYAAVDVPAASVPLYGQWLVHGTGATWPGGLSEGLGW